MTLIKSMTINMTIVALKGCKFSNRFCEKNLDLDSSVNPFYIITDNDGGTFKFDNLPINGILAEMTSPRHEGSGF